ncbi:MULTISPECIES: hypothetical protein [unclassified Caballeronia]|uniref:hypothetical protein n=1 Tax=unclassified Caballeronia TaxID=2646786 RepID=UPI001F1EB13D|nr:MULTISPECIES: hypothetical protein [unclassified Caballeronia]MCE4547663.1 hypothetical protein [Caballeronia sp. PC1]MCE4575120.1 hypothetical protein [Caballeronia sp. CLC5]
MSNILPFTRLRTNDARSHGNDCPHRHIRLDKHSGTVSCSDCGAALTPFSALAMLAKQYDFAFSQIEHLRIRLARADSRILELRPPASSYWSPLADRIGYFSTPLL